MMRLAFAVFVAAFLTGCTSLSSETPIAAAASEEPGDAEAGRAFAEARCSSCHAVGETGASPYAPAPPLRTLHQKYNVEGLAEAFAEGILVGHKGPAQMPEFVLTPEEIDDLIAYLKSFE